MSTQTTAEPAGTPMYQLRFGVIEPDVIATYDNVRAAQEHAEYARRLAVRGPAETLTWSPETPAADSPLWLHATDAIDGESETAWHIVPGMVRTTFTPGCGES